MGAIGSGLGKACSQADFEAINAALGRMIASVPEGKVMAVYDAFSKLVSSDVPPYLMSTVKEADARAAYSALMEFKDVVKANPITPAAVSAPSNAQIDAAAVKLSATAYPFLKVMDVYNAFGKVVSADVPNYLIRTVNAGDARAAYSALMEFKDVVKASR